MYFGACIKLAKSMTIKTNIKWFCFQLSGCGLPDFQGDGACDDGNNNAGCNFDGGDCCLPNVDTSFCTVCQCLETTTPPPTGGMYISGAVRIFNRWVRNLFWEK